MRDDSARAGKCPSGRPVSGNSNGLACWHRCGVDDGSIGCGAVRRSDNRARRRCWHWSRCWRRGSGCFACPSIRGSAAVEVATSRGRRAEEDLPNLAGSRGCRTDDYGAVYSLSAQINRSLSQYSRSDQPESQDLTHSFLDYADWVCSRLSCFLNRNRLAHNVAPLLSAMAAAERTKAIASTVDQPYMLALMMAAMRTFLRSSFVIHDRVGIMDRLRCWLLLVLVHATSAICSCAGCKS